MHSNDPHRLLMAARTAIHLFDMFYDLMMHLYPNELLSLTQDQERDVARLLGKALAEEERRDDRAGQTS